MRMKEQRSVTSPVRSLCLLSITSDPPGLPLIAPSAPATRPGFQPRLGPRNLTAPHLGLCHVLQASYLRAFPVSSSETLGFSLGTDLDPSLSTHREASQKLRGVNSPEDHSKPAGEGPSLEDSGGPPHQMPGAVVKSSL